MINISRTLKVVALCATIISVYIVCIQLQTQPIDCTSNTCLSLIREQNYAMMVQGSLRNSTRRNIRARTSIDRSTQLEDEVAEVCQFPDPRDDRYSKFYNILAPMRVLIPESFHPKFKNPCWYSSFSIPQLRGKTEKFYNESFSLFDLMNVKKQNESKTLQCLPYFFIAGFPRSGTTAIYSLINQHPQFTEAAHKEIHWLTHSKFDSTFPNNLKSVLRYIYHFDRAANKIKQNANLVTCDASASTLWDTFFQFPTERIFDETLTFGCEAPLLLSYILPNAKYIVMLRNPLERLYSEFWYHCRNDYRLKQVIKSGPRMFHQLAEESLNIFFTCKSHRSLFQCFHLWQQQLEKGRCNFITLHTSLYYLHIIKWLSVIPRKQFFFIRSEDFFRNPQEVLKKVFEFLELSPISNQTRLESFLKFKDLNENEHKEYSNQDTAFLDETKLLLGNFYGPYNRKLADLLQDKRFLWDDV